MANPQAIMAAKNTDLFPASSVPPGKRKLVGDNFGPALKKRRASPPRTESAAPNQTATSMAPTAATISSPYSQIYSPLLSKLNGKFEVKAMSVMPSTSISKHVDRALEHLGRFSAWDQTVLPGVVLLCAKSPAASKLLTISELIKRRVNEIEQKWFQYNVLGETVLDETLLPVVEQSVVEDTFTPVDREAEEDAEDDEYFETMQPTIHERAVQPPKVRHQAHIMILLSRVPLDELKTEKNVSLQTNESHIDYLRQKRMGLVG
ncbi:hypothetical protein VTK26DRAFT_4711 [Humicola hyalothermophila]